MRWLTRSMVALACAAVLSAGLLSAPATAAPVDGPETPAGTVVTQDMLQDAGRAAAASGLAFLHSIKCLDILGFATGDGATAGQWACNGAPNQQWTFEWYTNDSFQLRVSHSRKCLDILGFATANSATAGQWTCNGAFNQRFKAYASSGVDGWIFQNQHSGKCLDILGFATGNSATAGQWTCNWASNQRIVLI